MTEEQKEELAKSRHRIEILNKLRLTALFIAILLLLFVFWGGKLWEQAAWFIEARQKVYNFMLYDVALLVIVTFAKLFAAMRYNRKVSKWSNL